MSKNLISAMGGGLSVADLLRDDPYLTSASTNTGTATPAPLSPAQQEERDQEMLSEVEQRFIAKLADAVGGEYAENAVEWQRRGVNRAHVDFFLASLERMLRR